MARRRMKGSATWFISSRLQAGVNALLFQRILQSLQSQAYLTSLGSRPKIGARISNYSAYSFQKAYLTTKETSMKRITFICMVLLVGVGAAFVPPAVAQHEHPAGDPSKLGKVSFPVSCEPSVQPQFSSAVAMLHSFWYEKASDTFAAIAQKDPTCGMAYWGIAMTYYHQVWQAPGPADLEAGIAAVEKAKLAGAKTQRERDYIAAIETFYKDADQLDYRTRALAYEKAVDQLQARYPDDHEAAIFYALALLATAPPTDKTYVNQKKAGAILEPLFAEQPEHPGIAHYIIHAYDYPPLADRALDAARRYAQIAPDSPHALTCRPTSSPGSAYGRSPLTPTSFRQPPPRKTMRPATSCTRRIT
jgi:hypothetical protein